MKSTGWVSENDLLSPEQLFGRPLQIHVFPLVEMSQSAGPPLHFQDVPQILSLLSSALRNCMGRKLKPGVRGILGKWLLERWRF